MKFNAPLKSAKLLRRYKRFLVDLDDGQHSFTAHCANTGKMTGCADSGFIAYYSTSENKKRKYPNSLELTRNNSGQLICVNTQIANKVILEALKDNAIAELSGYERIHSEVKYGDEKSRIDFYLQGKNKVDCFVEVKSVTLLDNDQGYFPDTQTLRGQKHLRELIKIQQQGKRAVLVFTVLHEGINSVAPAAHIDEKYTALLKLAKQNGVEVYAYKCQISETEIRLNKKINVLLT